MVYVGKTGNELCLVAAIMAYLAIRGTTSGPFFLFEDGTPLHNLVLLNKYVGFYVELAMTQDFTRVTVLGSALPPQQQPMI